MFQPLPGGFAATSALAEDRHSQPVESPDTPGPAANAKSVVRRKIPVSWKRQGQSGEHASESHEQAFYRKPTVRSWIGRT